MIKSNSILITIIGLMFLILGFIDMTENEPSAKTGVMIMGGAIVFISGLLTALSSVSTSSAEPSK